MPSAPTYYTNPNLLPNIDWFSQEGRGLTSGDFTGSRSWLADLVDYDPRSTKLALESAKGFLQPQFNDIVQQIRNEAAANNQLESSTFTDALAKNASNLESQYQGIASNAALNDLNQAKSNKLGLYEFGANLMNTGTGYAQGESNSKNQFNLTNYENQVAAALAGQKTASPMFGGLGTALGVGLGALLALPTGGLSVLAGAGLGGAIGGGLGGSIDAMRGASGSGGFSGMGASLGLMGQSGGFNSLFGNNLTMNRSLGGSYLPGMMTTSDLLSKYGGLSPYSVPKF